MAQTGVISQVGAEPEGAARPNYLWRYRYDRTPADGRSWREITQEVIDAYRLSWDEILGRSQERRVAWPRQEAWSVIWAQGRLSLPEIGRRFDRDHTTVLHGVRQHAKRMAQQARFA